MLCSADIAGFYGCCGTDDAAASACAPDVPTALHDDAVFSACALGYFDGVHLGHRAVIGAAVAYAKQHALASAVFSFSLPLRDNANADEMGAVKGSTVLTPTEKRRRMAALGVERYLCPPFESFCTLTPEAFVENVLCTALRAKAVFCGEDFTFGAHKAGNVALLQTLCAAKDICVFIIPTALYKGEAVSSTRIRAALAGGDVGTAGAMLAEPYAIDLPVQRGRGLGTTLGVPTINQHYPAGMLRPLDGVYLSRVWIGNACYLGATGIGSRPTVNGRHVTCETFILDFSGDLYGQAVRVELHSFWRHTQRYENTEALRNMINEAADAARAYFAEKPTSDL